MSVELKIRSLKGKMLLNVLFLRGYTAHVILLVREYHLAIY